MGPPYPRGNIGGESLPYIFQFMVLIKFLKNICFCYNSPTRPVKERKQVVLSLTLKKEIIISSRPWIVFVDNLYL